MPRPAPSTVPASSPIKNEPPPSSRSNRSYSYAMQPPVVSFGRCFLDLEPPRGRGGRLRPVFAVQQRDDRGAYTTHDTRRLVHLVHHRALQVLRRVIYPMDGSMNGVVNALSFVIDTSRHRLDVAENGIHLLTNRRNLPRLEIVDQRHHPAINHEATDADADE